MISNKFKLSLIFLASTLFFLLFSRYGMHVTDDGIILAAAKRILVDGQIPHRDFIHLRPVGTFWLWIIPVYWGGDYTHLISRFFVMLQFCLIAFSWLEVFCQSFNYKTSTSKWILLYIASCLFSISTFWIFPLYTTDGVFLCSLGFYFSSQPKGIIKYLGYMLIGCAGLAKQNFFGFIPFAILSLKDLKNIKAYIFSGIPLLSYLVFLTSNNALNDFIFQMSVFKLSDTFYGVAIQPFIENKSTYRSLVLFLLVVNFSKLKKRFNWRERSYLFIPTLILFYVLQTLFIDGFTTRVPIVFFIFSLLYMIYISIKEGVSDKVLYFLAACSLAWFSSFSLTFHFPHAAVYLFLPVYWILDKNFLKKISHKEQKVFYLSALCLLLIGFYYNRRNYTFEMSTAQNTPNHINYEYPGAKGMVVGDLMFSIMKELNLTVHKYKKQNKTISIVPDFTNFWVSYKQVNPLPSIWIQQADIGHDKLVSWIQATIRNFDSGNIVILENYHGVSLHLREDGSQELVREVRWAGPIQKIVDTVKNELVELERTEYFIIYQGTKDTQ